LAPRRLAVFVDRRAIKGAVSMQSSDFGPLVSPLAQYAKGGRTKTRGKSSSGSMPQTVAHPMAQVHPALVAQHQRGMMILGALARSVLAHRVRQAVLSHLLAGGR
jgi:hypothetical protein